MIIVRAKKLGRSILDSTLDVVCRYKQEFLSDFRLIGL